MQKFTIAIHGGAGTILKEDMDAQLEAAYNKALQNALDKGYEILAKNGSSLDAVQAAVIELENCILFNAGRGSVFTKKGEHEMDAAMMYGLDLSAGAVCGVQHIKNPVSLARAIMDKSDHVMLSGNEAKAFALNNNVEVAGDSYFFSQFRYEQWKAVRDTNATALDHNIHEEQLMRDKKFGTVGAVACDANGNVAAATSTGGMTNKQYGRIGDTPIIGAGNYANNKTCAISCTGHGELFIKAVAAYDVSCLMEYKGLSLQEAMEVVTLDKLVKINGEGGMIGVDAKGNAALVFNSAGMYRGLKNNEGINEVKIYK